MYKMVVITIENCPNAKVHTIEVKNRDFFFGQKRLIYKMD